MEADTGLLALTALRGRALGRFTASLAISLGLHAGLLALPQGNLGWEEKKSPQHQLTLTLPASLVASVHLLSPTFTHTDNEPAPVQQVAPQAPLYEEVLGTPATPDFAEQSSSSFGIPAPVYLDSSEVSIQPVLLDEITLESPEENIFPRTGQAILSLYVSETGVVDRYEIEEENLGESAAQALALRFAQATFQPARVGDTPVRSRIRIEVLIRPLP